MQDHDNATYTNLERRTQAALRIQRAWRKKSAIGGRSQLLDTNSRWKDAAVHAQMKLDRLDADKGKNDPRTRWKRSVFLAARIQDTNAPYAKDRSEQEVLAYDKILETQHWLELVDARHRYGSNLKWYHRRWQQEDTADNFFKWLDQGEGKNLSLDECPRERLEEERIVYLAPEQRLNYLVNIDNEGKLRWARNGVLVDTTAGRWKDQGQGRGIVPHYPEEAENPPVPRRDSFNMASSVSTGSIVEENMATHYVGPEKGKTRLARSIRGHLTMNGMMDRLLRKTVQRNTWIYVADKSFNIFIGIKETGSFQHSSFLAGGIVTSAGLISVKDGVIHKLSPLSGHYRTSIRHFRHFIGGLSDRGVDMHKAKISKAEAVLWGFEQIAKAKKIKRKVVDRSKHNIKAIATVGMDDGGDGGSVLATWKKEVLEGRHKESVLKGRETDSRPSDASPSSNREDARKESAEDGPSSSKGGGSTELHNTELSPVQDESSFAAAGPQLERKGSKAS